MYKNRFHTLQDSKDHIRSLSTMDIYSEIIQLQIIIVPSLLDPQLIDTTDNEVYDWLNPNNIDYEPSGFIYAKRHGFLPYFPKPSNVGISFDDEQAKKQLHIHRNGSIQYVSDVGYEMELDNRMETTVSMYCIQYPILAVRLMQVFQFAEDVLSHYNYFGDVEILIKLISRNTTWGIKWEILQKISKKLMCH